MKTLRIIPILALFISVCQVSFAQKTTTEKIPVSGNCGMCKHTIEKAAKTAGATHADWDMESKILTVSYNRSATSANSIQQAIASVGYDTRDVKANDEAYNKLHACCKYERTATTKAACCDKPNCDKNDKCCSEKDCKS